MAAENENPRVYLDIDIGGEPIGRYSPLSFVCSCPSTCSF